MVTCSTQNNTKTIAKVADDAISTDLPSHEYKSASAEGMATDNRRNAPRVGGDCAANRMMSSNRMLESTARQSAVANMIQNIVRPCACNVKATTAAMTPMGSPQ